MAKRLLQWIPALLVLSIGFGLSYYWLTNKPKAKAKTAQKSIPLVEFIQPQVIDHPTTIQAMGSIIPARRVNLTSRINGMVTAVNPNFIPGGFLKKGEQIVQLDPTDYKLTIAEKENELAQAQFELTLEKGHQAIAQREFKLLSSQLDAQSKELVLRKPHLALAKSKVNAAQAALKQAQLNLQRTKTKAPFNSIILETNAQIGSWVSTFSTGTPLVKLAGIDRFWIAATLPVKQLKYIDIPGINNTTGASVKISHKAAWEAQAYRTGTVIRLQAELEDTGRMAQIIIEVLDPLSQSPANKDAPPLILGSFVRADITGRILQNVVAIPDTLLYNGQQILLLSAKNTLSIINVKPVWKEHGKIFIAGSQLPDNARIISSPLTTPVQGMQLRISNKQD
ncbi:MAG: membrane fusion protein, multidrug efflux system [Methyloprofundus sp.]|nr:MAG: membrane fusion protein, multidrug efflux system [Methyloprofundus sp.]